MHGRAQRQEKAWLRGAGASESVRPWGILYVDVVRVGPAARWRARSMSTDSNYASARLLVTNTILLRNLFS
jgi:hypothetical protein